MSKIARAVEVENVEEYLSLGDLRALVALSDGFDDDARVTSAEEAIDHLRVEEIPKAVGA